MRLLAAIVSSFSGFLLFYFSLFIDAYTESTFLPLRVGSLVLLGVGIVHFFVKQAWYTRVYFVLFCLGVGIFIGSLVMGENFKAILFGILVMFTLASGLLHKRGGRSHAKNKRV